MTCSIRNLLLVAGVLAVAAIPLRAQMHDNTEKKMTCDDRDHSDHLVTHCEIKEQAMPASAGAIHINPGPNGGITVKGWNRSDMLVRAKIQTSAPSDGEARAMTPQVRFASGPGELVAQGPWSDENHHWTVSYEIFVPHQTDFDATTQNGGVHIQDIKGTVKMETTNGGLHLARLAGNVTATTTNGGVHIELMGDRWDGTGLNVQTTNGGVHVDMPTSYSAHVETSTVNGGMHVDFPVMVQGKISKELSFDVGGGGPTIRAVTTNGGVHIQRS